MNEREIEVDAGTAAGSLCSTCRRVHVPARLHCCQRCGSRALVDVRVPLQGTFESWTSASGPGTDSDQFALGLVTLDAGPMMTVRIRLTQFQQPAVGARVSGWVVRRPRAVEQFWFELVADELARPEAAA